jgi:hypothetical protein
MKNTSPKVPIDTVVHIGISVNTIEEKE